MPAAGDGGRGHRSRGGLCGADTRREGVDSGRAQVRSEEGSGKGLVGRPQSWERCCGGSREEMRAVRGNCLVERA